MMKTIFVFLVTVVFSLSGYSMAAAASGADETGKSRLSNKMDDKPGSELKQTDKSKKINKSKKNLKPGTSAAAAKINAKQQKASGDPHVNEKQR